MDEFHGLAEVRRSAGFTLLFAATGSSAGLALMNQGLLMGKAML
jgi:hypothetical protein